MTVSERKGNITEADDYEAEHAIEFGLRGLLIADLQNSIIED